MTPRKGHIARCNVVGEIAKKANNDSQKASESGINAQHGKIAKCAVSFLGDATDVERAKSQVENSLSDEVIPNDVHRFSNFGERNLMRDTMEKDLILIRFEGLDAAEMSEYSEQIADHFIENIGNVELKRVRDNPKSMDLGSAIVFVYPGLIFADALLTWWKYRHAKLIEEEKQKTIREETKRQAEEIRTLEMEAEIKRLNLELKKLDKKELVKVRIRVGVGNAVVIRIPREDVEPLREYFQAIRNSD